MDKSTLLTLIDEPQHISEADLERLEEIAATYPYFQITHFLIAKYTQDKESMLAPQKIRRAASYAYDRNQLRKLIQGNTQDINNGSDIKLKTHFEPVDSDAPKMISTFDQVEENLGELPQKEAENQDSEASTSFFDVIEDEQEQNAEIQDSNQPDTILGEEQTDSPSQIDANLAQTQDLDNSQNTEEETSNSFFDEIDPEASTDSQSTDSEEISEEKALNLFHDGNIEGAERMFKQLVLLHPEKAAYYYRQLEILTDKPEYAELAKEHTPQEEKQAAPFFENIPDSSLSETETLINQASDTSSESESFFEGIEGEEEQNEDSEITIEAQSNEEEHSSEDEIISADSQDDEELENTPNSFFDDLNTDDDEEENQPEYSLDEITSVVDSKEPNQITENQEEFFSQLAALEDIHSVERSADEEENPFEELNRQKADASETEEPFEFKPEPKPDTSFFSESKSENEPPVRERGVIEDEISEPKAIHFFNQGRNKEAIEIYEQLLEKNPQKASYYLSQINVIKNQETEQSKTTQENIQQTTESPRVTPISRQEEEEGEELNERLAIQLFNDGKLEESIAIYMKLRDRETRIDKKAYYDQQIEILKS